MQVNRPVEQNDKGSKEHVKAEQQRKRWMGKSKGSNGWGRAKQALNGEEQSK